MLQEACVDDFNYIAETYQCSAAAALPGVPQQPFVKGPMLQPLTPQEACWPSCPPLLAVPQHCDRELCNWCLS